MSRMGRGDFQFRVIIWTKDRRTIYQEIAGSDNLSIGEAAYRMAVEKFPGEHISFQDGIRVIERTWKGEL